MTIEPVNIAQINSVGSPSSVSEAKPSSVDPTSEHLGTDTANLSGVNDLLEKAMEQPEIRMDKVEAIKSQIADGSYDLDPSKIADALVSSESRE